MKVREVHLQAYDLVEVRSDMMAAVMLGVDVCTHSDALGPETPFHTWKFRILEQRMDWGAVQVQFAKTPPRNHADSLGK